MDSLQVIFFKVLPLLLVLNQDQLCRHRSREAGSGEGFSNGTVAVEVDLPVVVVMAEGTYGKNRSDQSELEYFHLHCRLCQHVGHGCQLLT